MTALYEWSQALVWRRNLYFTLAVFFFLTTALFAGLFGGYYTAWKRDDDGGKVRDISGVGRCFGKTLVVEEVMSWAQYPASPDPVSIFSARSGGRTRYQLQTLAEILQKFEGRNAAVNRESNAKSVATRFQSAQWDSVVGAMALTFVDELPAGACTFTVDPLPDLDKFLCKTSTGTDKGTRDCPPHRFPTCVSGYGIVVPSQTDAPTCNLLYGSDRKKLICGMIDRDDECICTTGWLKQGSVWQCCPVGQMLVGGSTYCIIDSNERGHYHSVEAPIVMQLDETVLNKAIDDPVNGYRNYVYAYWNEDPSEYVYWYERTPISGHPHGNKCYRKGSYTGIQDLPFNTLCFGSQKIPQEIETPTCKETEAALSVMDNGGGFYAFICYIPSKNPKINQEYCGPYTNGLGRYQVINTPWQTSKAVDNRHYCCLETNFGIGLTLTTYNPPDKTEYSHDPTHYAGPLATHMKHGKDLGLQGDDFACYAL